mgnify:CR=1 FL=1
MTDTEKNALLRLVGRIDSPRASTDELQGLLLQVVFALLMVFVIAYFMFVAKAEKEREEQVMELNRQKLTLALDKVGEDYRIRYGLNALMVQGADGKRVFEADGFVAKGKLVMTPAMRTAFSSGSISAAADYAGTNLVQRWRDETFKAAGLAEDALHPAEAEWFAKELTERIEAVRLDVRGVQRLQKQWIEDPRSLSGLLDKASAGNAAATAGEVAHELKVRSLKLLSEEAKSEMLP